MQDLIIFGNIQSFQKKKYIIYTMQDQATLQDVQFVSVRGERVPALGLGTWQMTGATCTEAVEHALDIGYRHIDTAQAYENENAIRTALTRSRVAREEYFLTTKIWVANKAPADVRASSEASLRRLGVDYVDLLLIHWPGGDVPIEHTLDAMIELRSEGKIRHVGVSNFTPSLLDEALAHTDIFCNQVEYHPFLGQEALCKMAPERDVMLTAYCPLARGRVSNDETLAEVAEAHGKSAAQVTLRWLLQQENVAAAPKAASAGHREANIDVFDFVLSRAEMAQIHGLARGKRLISPDFAPEW